MNEIRTEQAEIKDAATILSIQKEAYLSEAKIYNDYSLPPLTQTLEQLTTDFSEQKFYVAKKAGDIIGSVNLEIKDKTGYIGRLIVKPEYQAKGIGSLLLAHAESVAVACDVSFFELFTGHKSSRNLNIYKNKGYQEVRRKKIHEGLELVFLQKLNNVRTRT